MIIIINQKILRDSIRSGDDYIYRDLMMNVSLSSLSTNDTSRERSVDERTGWPALIKLSNV